jgi:hypothetical protein
MIVVKRFGRSSFWPPQGNVMPTFGKLRQPRFAAAATSSADPHPPTCLAPGGRLTQQFLESRKLFKLVGGNVFG